jgi:hypothetical protein
MGGAPSHLPLQASLTPIFAPVGAGVGTNVELREAGCAASPALVQPRSLERAVEADAQPPDAIEEEQQTDPDQ